jgi:Predicted membrane protein (DUF2207) C-terminal domain/Predicted membrane protein (DUF2207) N-terminal domain
VLTNWGTFAVSIATAASAFLGAAPPGGIDDGQTTVTGLPGTVYTNIAVRVERDGKLTVTEKVTVPDGKTANRDAPLRIPAGDVDRVFTVSNVSVQGHGTSEVSGDEFKVHLTGGESTIKYTVDGAVDNVGDGQEVKWRVAGNWDVELDAVNVSFSAPAEPKSLSCKAGPSSSDASCDNASMPTGQVHADERGLKPDQRIDLTVGFDKDALPANARYEEPFNLAAAFALTPVSGIGLAALLLLLVGGFAALWYARGRDTKALASEVGPVDVLHTDSAGHVHFASPDGVLPGQVGTVADEHVDVIDVSATVIDLAVRNYLWIEEIAGDRGTHDWRIVRRNPPDEHLRPYEVATFEALFGAGDDQVEQVLLSGLRAGKATGKALDMSRARDAMYRDVVDKSWFKRRPDADRSRWWWTGVGISALGVVLTVVLALTSTVALIGLAVVAGGVALTVGARSMPARTSRGSALIQQMRGLREYLHSVRPEQIPDTDREMVFSRSLPYAIVLGLTDRWLDTFAELDPDADGTPGLYWFGEAAASTDLHRFARHFPNFVSSLDGVLAQAGHLRSLRA